MKNRKFATWTNVGALMVLLASAGELTIERSMKDSLESAVINRTEEKIESIWWLLADEHSKRPENRDGPWIGTNLRAHYDRMVHPRKFDGLEAQLAWVERIRVWTQLLGGVLILIGAVRNEK